MDDQTLMCSKCDEVVVKRKGSVTKIRSKVLLIKGGQTLAVCKGCGTDLELPVTIELSTLVNKSVSRLYIKE